MCILIIIVCRYLYILYIRRPLLGRARVLLYLAPVEAADSTPRLETSSSYIGSRWPSERVVAITVAAQASRSTKRQINPSANVTPGAYGLSA